MPTQFQRLVPVLCQLNRDIQVLKAVLPSLDWLFMYCCHCVACGCGAAVECAVLSAAAVVASVGCYYFQAAVARHANGANRRWEVNQDSS